MNEADKQRVDAAKKRKSGGRQAAEQGTQNLQDGLKQSAQAAGHLLADNFGAEMLKTAVCDMQAGRFGSKTAAILEALRAGSIDPLEDWDKQIATWNQPALLSSSVEPGG